MYHAMNDDDETNMFYEEEWWFLISLFGIFKNISYLCCDLLESIREYDSGLPTEAQVKKYMVLIFNFGCIILNNICLCTDY